MASKTNNKGVAHFFKQFLPKHGYDGFVISLTLSIFSFFHLFGMEKLNAKETVPSAIDVPHGFATTSH
ncbi:hypothetical protein Patl1_27526 [Pistacia atlantica]|uniref:Uncharacterized protein n=1 Tax=Pistacia atlantica TaxID=434234 RepID=A0ACC1BF87_9ROSI|nr:hypothetical protein Patl1_27526 [Pistacia atlantica]